MVDHIVVVAQPSSQAVLAGAQGVAVAAARPAQGVPVPAQSRAAVAPQAPFAVASAGTQGPPGRDGSALPLEVVLAESVASAGLPVAISRSSHQGILARSDAYTKSFVVGLSMAPAVSGFVCDVADKNLTLSDWTATSGSVSLTPGSLYYLGLTGGLATTPDFSGQAVTVVGEALTATTMKLLLNPPILL